MNTISKKTLQTRVKTLQTILKEKDIKALLVTNPLNVKYLSNFTGSNGQLLITPREAFFLTDFRYLIEAKNILPPNIALIQAKNGLIKELQSLHRKLKFPFIHFEERNVTYHSYSLLKKNLAPVKLKRSNGLIETLRVVKSEEEIKLITKAQRIAEKVFVEVRKNLKIGKTETDICWEIETLGHQYGADGISFPSIVAFNENSAVPHHQSGNKKLKKGDVILIDMGMIYQGYCSDMTRMIFTKTPSKEQHKIYNIVLKAQEESIQKLKKDIAGNTVDECARDIIANAGYGKTFGHSLGHGIGLEVHENPNLSAHDTNKIQENTIVTDEPGIYLEKNFGVRIEDMLLIRHDKVINLTGIPKKIEESIHLL